MIETGVDLIEIERIEQAIERHGDPFLRRIFTSRELISCKGRADSLAGRFAVKEAVSKALGTGIGEFSWTEIEIVRDTQGKPQLELHNNALEKAQEMGIKAWSISLSHTETHAIGMAVALIEQGNL